MRTVTLVRALEVVELKEAVERGLQLEPLAEVASAEANPPGLVEDRPLQPFDEAVRQGMSWLGSGVAHVQPATCHVELAFELIASVGQHPLWPPPPIGRSRRHHLPEEGCGFGGVAHCNHLGQRVRTGSIADGCLPRVACSLQLPDLERVNAHKLIGLLRLHVTSPRSSQAAAGSLGQQAGARCAVPLERQQPLHASTETDTTQSSPDGGRRDDEAALCQLQ